MDLFNLAYLCATSFILLFVGKHTILEDFNLHVLMIINLIYNINNII